MHSSMHRLYTHLSDLMQTLHFFYSMSYIFHCPRFVAISWVKSNMSQRPLLLVTCHIQV